MIDFEKHKKIVNADMKGLKAKVETEFRFYDGCSYCGPGQPGKFYQFIDSHGKKSWKVFLCQDCFKREIINWKGFEVVK